MKIRIMTSCTGDKKHSPANQLTQADFQLLPQTEVFASREAELNTYRTPAEDLYTGQQHIRLMRGVQLLRQNLGPEKVDLWILSAGYGIIPGSRSIVPYECTFQGMKSSDIKLWGAHLHTPEDARLFFSQSADLTLVFLGDSYLQALQLDEQVVFGAPTLFLTSTGSDKLVQGQGNWRTLPLTSKDASRFSCGLVGLKGELAHRLSSWLTQQGSDGISTLFNSETDLRTLLDAQVVSILPAVKTKAPKKAVKPTAADKPKRAPAQANPNVDQVIQIPDLWWQKPHRAKLRYFIPDWDDLVDPDYDFENDEHSGGMGDWSNQVYAHQMYPEPNYDGILISKVVAEKSLKKKQRINEMGVHRYLRVPRKFPIMGDCGAFGYIGEEVPPYTTPEILDYYTRLDFAYGVSIDHLIVVATGQQRQFRYDLTIHNAEEFIKEHHKLGLAWDPIGAVQGWDPQSYAEAARQYVAMGYKYIGLGGLVRTKTTDILRILQSVHEVVPNNVSMHLFGLARLDAMTEFSKLGITSVDSASPLRRAWLGSSDNYWTLDGNMYAAIRIPESGKSFRAKRMVTEERAEAKKVEELEKACFEAVIKFDKGLLTVEQTLNVLEDFDHLITPDRPSMREISRRTLEAMPWKYCPCDICKKDGVHTVIFRGNNRNRRRGFHNVFVFYQLLQKVLAGEQVFFKGKIIDQTTYQLGLF